MFKKKYFSKGRERKLAYLYKQKGGFRKLNFIRCLINAFLIRGKYGEVGSVNLNKV